MGGGDWKKFSHARASGARQICLYHWCRLSSSVLSFAAIIATTLFLKCHPPPKYLSCPLALILFVGYMDSFTFWYVDLRTLMCSQGWCAQSACPRHFRNLRKNAALEFGSMHVVYSTTFIYFEVGVPNWHACSTLATSEITCHWNFGPCSV